MALQGTIDTFELGEVIRMLAQGEKTGQLELSGDRGSGSLWFEDGQVVGSETDTSPMAADHAAVLFQLLRFTEGAFVFNQGAQPSEGGEATAAEPILDEAIRRLEEWTLIEDVVPSLSHRVDLCSELSRSDVVIDQVGWRAVAAIGGGRSVGDLGRALEQDELDVSRTVKTLVELGLVEVGDEKPGAYGGPPPDEVGAVEIASDEVLTADHPLDIGTADESDDIDSGPSGFDPSWPDEGLQMDDDPEPVDAGSRDQLDALASGFGLTDDPSGTDSIPVEPAPVTEPLVEPGESLDFRHPAPPAGAADEDGASFPIEEAEAAGEATTPLFAHDAGQAPVPGPDPAGLTQPGEAAEVARQLANLSPEAAHAVAAAARATTDEEREAALALVAEDGDEPLDPDLLRSFLSSVRH